MFVRSTRFSVLKILWLWMLVAFAALNGGMAQAAQLLNVELPIDTYAFIPCAVGGAGEYIHIIGVAHFTLEVTTPKGGGFLNKFGSNYQGLEGVGLTTGDSYRGTGASNAMIFTQNPQTAFASAATFRFTGQGPGNDLMAHTVVHVTIDANGNVRVENVTITTSCT